MSDAAQSRQYFLGIGGQQSGPFSEAEMVQQWQTGQIPAEALAWYEGLDDWKLAAEVFAGLSAGAGRPVTSAPGLLSRPHKDTVNFSTFATKEQGLNPVFDDDDAGGTESFFLRFRLHIFLGTVVFFGFLVAAGFYIYTSVNGPRQSKPSVPVAAKTIDRRDTEYRSAVADVLLNPDRAMSVFERLVKDNSSDEIGKQSLESAIDYYKRSQRFHEIGRLLVAAKRPVDAIGYFRGEQPSPNEELNALQLSFVQTKKPEFLLQEIELLLGPLNSSSKAIEMIRKLEQEFPKAGHPYGYFLKSTDEQIADLFSRISFYFVQSLLSFIESELPQIHLARRPLVELKRDRAGGFRIEGSYRGDVTLSRDPLKNIHLVFWFVDDLWVLVETNLTKERAKWSAREKEKLAKTTMTASKLLDSLEQRFRSQFPKSSLHHSVRPADAAKQTKTEE